jgi:hypothetical protein
MAPAQAPNAAAADASAFTNRPDSSPFDERWGAWQAKGTAHDRAVLRKAAIAAPLLLSVVAVILYVFLGR